MKNYVYLGKEYSDSEIEEALEKYCPNKYQKFEDIESVTAQYISKGYIVGWFQGRSEIGQGTRKQEHTCRSQTS